MTVAIHSKTESTPESDYHYDSENTGFVSIALKTQSRTDSLFPDLHRVEFGLGWSFY